MGVYRAQFIYSGKNTNKTGRGTKDNSYTHIYIIMNTPVTTSIDRCENRE